MVDDIRLYLNGKDAFEEFGAFLGEKAMTTLMTPPPNKAYIENKSTLADGKEVLITDDMPARVDERDFTISINIKGGNPIDMLKNYRALCQLLKGGAVDLSTNIEPDITYHLVYVSCTQMRTYFKGSAMFDIRFNEPNPNNR